VEAGGRPAWVENPPYKVPATRTPPRCAGVLRFRADGVRMCFAHVPARQARLSLPPTAAKRKTPNGNRAKRTQFAPAASA
jgi:hypothetical protein